MNTENTSVRIGKRLKQLRIEKRLTQSELASKAGLNANYYAKIERGEVSPSLEAYEKIAKALMVRSSDIFPF